MQLAQIAKIVTCCAAIDVGGTGPFVCAHINMAKYNHVTFLISVGAIGNNCAITITTATTSLGAGPTAIGYKYYLSTGGAALLGVVASALVTVGAGGYTLLAASDDNETMVIEIDAAELTVRASQYVGVNIANAAGCLISVLAVCLEPRWEADPNIMPDPTVA